MLIRLIGFLIVSGLAVGVLTTAYLAIRSFHHKWKWQNRVNENNLRRSILEELDIQYEVDETGFVRPVKRKN